MSETNHTDTSIAEGERPAEPLPTHANSEADVANASRPEPEVAGDESVVLLANADDYHRRWEPIQSAFVDEPRRAVEEADALVAEVIGALADSFSNERQRLEGQWSSGDDVSTDDLRIMLQRYRSFFQRLLAR